MWTPQSIAPYLRNVQITVFVAENRESAEFALILFLHQTNDFLLLVVGIDFLELNSSHLAEIEFMKKMCAKLLNELFIAARILAVLLRQTPKFALREVAQLKRVRLA